jgi:hypothetical protein
MTTLAQRMWFERALGVELPLGDLPFLTENAPYMGITPQYVTLSFETAGKLYDLRIEKGGKVSYAVNSQDVPDLPKTPGTKRLRDFYKHVKDAAERYLAEPSNESWWALKNLGRE